MNNFRLQLPNFNSKFGAILLAITIALAAVGLGGWWWLQRNSPLNIQAELLHTPAAAKFLPRKANLSIYLQLDPNQLPAYGRAIATAKQRKNAALALAELRNNLFAITGLNYNSELSDWLGSETALALLANSNPQEQPNWILALSSRTPMGAREFLQRFWQNRSLAGGDLEISSYRGLGLISSSDPKAPLATALINDQLVLLASQREALEDALDSSQVDALNQANDPKLQGWRARNSKAVVKDGIVHLTADGADPFLGFGLGQTAGPATLKVRLRSQAGGPGKFESIGAGKDPAAAKSVAFTVAPGEWQELTAELPIKGPLGIVRLHLPATRQAVEIDWIEITAAGKPRRTTF
jgi:hypothetical protein